MNRISAVVLILLMTGAAGAAPPNKDICRPHVYSVKSCSMATGIYPWNGYFLEGPGLETLHFKSSFPPKAGASLQSEGACTDAPLLPAIKVRHCDTTQHEGAATCSVTVPAGTEICGKPKSKQPTTLNVFAVKGFWDGTGQWRSDDGLITLACADPDPNDTTDKVSVNSAVGTCVNAKYSLVSSKDKLLACVRAIRADYCGDGLPHTLRGTHIGLHDDSINQMTSATCDDQMFYEATWSPNGAVCQYHSRWTGDGMSDSSCIVKACDPKTSGGIVYTRSKCNVCPQDKNDHPDCAPDRDPVCASASSAKPKGH